MNTDTVRVAIISDTHGYIDPNVVDVILRCDQVIHAGDICGAHVLEQLAQLSSQVTAVAGNNDASGLWPIEETHVVNALPKIAHVQLPGGKLVISLPQLEAPYRADKDSQGCTYQSVHSVQASSCEKCLLPSQFFC